MDHRDDDVRGRGWCPVCGREVQGVTVAGRGVCEVHGWVWIEFTPTVRTSEEDDD